MQWIRSVLVRPAWSNLWIGVAVLSLTAGCQTPGKLPPGPKNPRTHQDHFKWATYYVNQNRQDLAEESYSRALELNPKPGARVTYLVNRGICRSHLGKDRPAMADLDEALALDASQNSARGLRSQLRRKYGDYPGALADLDYLVEKSGPGSFWRTSRAMTYAEAGDFERALHEADDALRHAKSDFLAAQFHIIKARVHALAEDFDLAFADLESAWQRSDNCNIRLTVWLLRGSFYEKMGQLDKATEAYRSCIADADLYLKKYRADARMKQVTGLLMHGIAGELLTPSARIGSHVAENYRQQAQENIERLTGPR